MFKILDETDSVRPAAAGGQDANRRRFAADAKLTVQDRARQSFARRHPNAMRVNVGDW